MVAAILHLGNVDFIKDKEADSSKLKDDKSHYHLQTAAELLMLELFSNLSLKLGLPHWSDVKLILPLNLLLIQV